MEYDEKNNKIIKLPIKNIDKEPKDEESEENVDKKSQDEQSEEKKNYLPIILSIIGLIIPIVIAIGNNITQIKLSEKSEVESKPILDFNFEYFEDDYYEDIPLNEKRKYLKCLSINMSNNNSEPIDVMIEPFFNILYYNQSKKAMIKQLLPIHDGGGIYDFFSNETRNIKNGTISEIKFNQNTYEIVKNIEDMFNDKESIDYDNFKNEFSDSVIMSIEFEFYITIKYDDIYKNNYSEVYLCKTGFGKASTYLNPIDLNILGFRNPDLEKYLIECEMVFSKLKVEYGESIEYNAEWLKISSDDEVYKDFNEFYIDIINTPGTIMYVPDFLSNLNELIELQYDCGQLLFLCNL